MRHFRVRVARYTRCQNGITFGKYLRKIIGSLASVINNSALFASNMTCESNPVWRSDMQRIIDAENSDLFDVLAHMAFALPTVTRLPGHQIRSRK